MAFVKLDCGILNSTLWVEREPRDIFITALLMAEPIELKDETPQFRVRGFEKTGFVVPPGWYGFVPAAGPGIARMAMVEQDAGLAALEKLGEPDAESRTPDFEGRRLVRVEGGYIVLNFMKYRDRDYTGAERARRYRERQKGKSVTRDPSSSRRDITQAEAEAEAEAEIRNKTPVVPKGTDLLGDPEAKDEAACPYDQIVDSYHARLPMLPKVRLMEGSRQRAVRKFWNWILTSKKSDGAKRASTPVEALEWVDAYFVRASENDFLTGRNGRSGDHAGWKCDLDFLLTDRGRKHVIERTEVSA